MMEAALKLAQIVKERSAASRIEHEERYNDASNAIDVARQNLDAAVKGGNQGAVDNALQLYKIHSDGLYYAAAKLFAARKAEQDDAKAAEDTIEASFVDLTEDEPGVVKIEDEGVSKYKGEDVDDDGGKVRAADVPMTGTDEPSKKAREDLDDGGGKKRAATTMSGEERKEGNMQKKKARNGADDINKAESIKVYRFKLCRSGWKRLL